MLKHVTTTVSSTVSSTVSRVWLNATGNTVREVCGERNGVKRAVTLWDQRMSRVKRDVTIYPQIPEVPKPEEASRGGRGWGAWGRKSKEAEEEWWSWGVTRGVTSWSRGGRLSASFRISGRRVKMRIPHLPFVMIFTFFFYLKNNLPLNNIIVIITINWKLNFSNTLCCF